MKKLILLQITLLLFSCVKAQSITCSDFTITDFGPNPWDSTQYVISIQFSGGPFDQINYPLISAVIDSNGDTVATGGLFFFGQLGGTTQDYPVTPSGNMNLTQFSVVFSYGTFNGTNDTCILFYPDALSSVHESISEESAFSIGPNPAADRITLLSKISALGAGYLIYDYAGKKMLEGFVRSLNEEIDLSSLTNGVYQIVFTDQTSKSIRFIKNQ
ncbi:MAG: T9SS type A sorting domain-containing protein [Bacteroidota bacterium]